MCSRWTSEGMRTMMLLFVAALMIIGPLAALLFLVAVPTFFGMMAYDLLAPSTARQSTVAEVEQLVVTREVERRASA